MFWRDKRIKWQPPVEVELEILPTIYHSEPMPPMPSQPPQQHFHGPTTVNNFQVDGPTTFHFNADGSFTMDVEGDPRRVIAEPKEAQEKPEAEVPARPTASSTPEEVGQYLQQLFMRTAPDGRINMEQMREIIKEGLPFSALRDLPPAWRLLIQALQTSRDEKEFFSHVVRIFHRFTNEEQYLMVWQAFEDADNPELGVIRRLMSELPENQQEDIAARRNPPKV